MLAAGTPLFVYVFFYRPTQQPDGSFSPNDIPPPQLIREIQPSAKFIITLSDPVKRLYSDYYFLADSLRPVTKANEFEKSAQQFHERVVAQISEFNDCIDAYMSQMASRSPTEYAIFNSTSNNSNGGSSSSSSSSSLASASLRNGLRFRAAQM